MAYLRSWVVDKAVMKEAGISPCKDCKDRNPGCAGNCEKFNAWKTRVNDLKREMISRERGERDAMATRREGYESALRNHEARETRWGKKMKPRRYT